MTEYSAIERVNSYHWYVPAEAVGRPNDRGHPRTDRFPVVFLKLVLPVNHLGGGVAGPFDGIPYVFRVFVRSDLVENKLGELIKSIVEW